MMKVFPTASLLLVIVLQLWNTSQGTTICEMKDMKIVDNWLKIDLKVSEDGPNWTEEHACTCEITSTKEGTLLTEVKNFRTTGSRDKYSCHPHLQLQHVPNDNTYSSHQMCASESKVHTPYENVLKMDEDTAVHLVLHNFNHQNVSGVVRLQLDVGTGETGGTDSLDVKCEKNSELPKVCPCNEVVEVATIVTIIAVFIILGILMLNCIVCCAHKGTNHYVENKKQDEA